MRRQGTTTCCSALALTVALCVTNAAQTPAPRPFPEPARRGDKATASTGPLALFPVRTLWTIPLNLSLAAPPGFDGTDAYFALEGDHLAAYDLKTAKERWRVSAHTDFQPVVGDGLVFLVQADALAALRTADGSVSWQLPWAERLAVPLVWDNGWLIASAASGTVYAFRAADGQLIWRRDVGSRPHARPALAGDRLYVPTEDGRVVALNVESGAPLWERRLGDAANDILALDERLYVGSNDKFLYSIDTKDGRVDWRWRTGADVTGVPIADERRVYFVSLDNLLRALDRRSGNQQWRRALPIRPTAGPVKAGETLLVVGLAPAVRGYNTKDGTAAGDITPGGEPVAPPHVFADPLTGLPVVVVVTRDIAKGATLAAVSRAIEPAIAPIATLPNVQPVVVNPPRPTAR